MYENKVKMGKGKSNSVPSHPVKTGGKTKGFGGGAMHGSLEGNDAITKGGRAIKGFSGGGLKGGKV